MKKIDVSNFTEDEKKLLEAYRNRVNKELLNMNLIEPKVVVPSSLFFLTETKEIHDNFHHSLEEKDVYEYIKKRLNKFCKEQKAFIKANNNLNLQEAMQQVLNEEVGKIKKVLNDKIKAVKDDIVKNKKIYDESVQKKLGVTPISSSQTEILLKNLIQQDEISNEELTDNKKGEVKAMENTIIVQDKTQDIEGEEYKKVLEELGKEIFIIDNGNLCFVKNWEKQDYKPVCNFIPVITRRIDIVNGINTTTKYVLKAKIIRTNEELPEITITKSQFMKGNFIIGSKWERSALLKEYGNKYLAQVLQISSKYMQEEIIYAHTGFVRIDGKLYYLYHGGAIGKNADNIKADLSADALTQYQFHNEELDANKSISLSYSIIDLANHSITIPLLITTYLAPFVSLLQEDGIFCDYALFIVGKTGTRKSSVASMLLSHYGIFARNKFSTSFSDTVNSAEKKAYVLKDTLYIADDLCPENDNARIHTLDKLLGMFGDRNGRGRMKSNGEALRKAYTARGLLLITGEFVPEIAQSRLARSIIINMLPDSINLERLTILQESAKELNFAMRKFIEWVIENEPTIRDEAKQQMKELQKSQNNQIHGRTNEGINCMQIVWRIYLKFLMEYAIISEEQATQLELEAETILQNIAYEQTKEVIEDKNPVNMFYNAIESMINSNNIHLLNYKTGTPINKNDKGTKLGYFDNNYYYLFPEITYQKVIQFYSKSKIKFSLNFASLWKTLQNEGLLYMTDPSRKTVFRVDPETKQKEKVVQIRRRNLEDNTLPLKQPEHQLEENTTALEPKVELAPVVTSGTNTGTEAGANPKPELTPRVETTPTINNPHNLPVSKPSKRRPRKQVTDDKNKLFELKDI